MKQEGSQVCCRISGRSRNSTWLFLLQGQLCLACYLIHLCINCIFTIFKARKRDLSSHENHLSTNSYLTLLVGKIIQSILMKSFYIYLLWCHNHFQAQNYFSLCFVQYFQNNSLYFYQNSRKWPGWSHAFINSSVISISYTWYWTT